MKQVTSPHLMASLLAAALVTPGLFGAGCSKSAPPAPVVPEEQPTRFSYTATNDVVETQEIEEVTKEGTTAVEADFNLDGKADLAVITPTATGDDQVQIFIRTPAPAKAPAKADPNSGSLQVNKPVQEYYRGGAIHKKFEGKVVGIATRRDGRSTDLILLVTRADGRNEMMHYANDGSGFKESEN